MPKTRLSTVIALMLLLLASAPRAQEPGAGTGAAERAGLDALLSSIRANRKALVAVNLTWTDDEATSIRNFTLFQRGESGGVVPVTGRYDDVCRKDDDHTWQIFSKATT